jgi:hypothetical protein
MLLKHLLKHVFDTVHLTHNTSTIRALTTNFLFYNQTKLKKRKENKKTTVV